MSKRKQKTMMSIDTRRSPNAWEKIETDTTTCWFRSFGDEIEFKAESRQRVIEVAIPGCPKLIWNTAAGPDGFHKISQLTSWEIYCVEPAQETFLQKIGRILTLRSRELKPAVRIVSFYDGSVPSKLKFPTMVGYRFLNAFVSGRIMKGEEKCAI